jgi:hypothetical protein
MKMLNRTRTLSAALLGLCLLGCGKSSTSVAGKVTYNGQPVEKGTISFRPSDGKGQVFAAEIIDGSYDIRTAVPGNRTVAIRGTKKVNFGRSSEEAAKLAAEAQAAGKAWGGHLAEPADYIPEDAEGNNRTIEVASGDQTIDFDLKGPPRK